MSLPLLKAPKGWKRARYIYIKGVTERFGFDVVESRKFKLIVKNKATGTLHGMFIYIPLLTIFINSHLEVYYILIGVGLSALLVSTIRAMREPYYVERASDWLHVFCMYVRELTYGFCQSGAD